MLGYSFNPFTLLTLVTYWDTPDEDKGPYNPTYRKDGSHGVSGCQQLCMSGCQQLCYVYLAVSRYGYLAVTCYVCLAVTSYVSMAVTSYMCLWLSPAMCGSDCHQYIYGITGYCIEYDAPQNLAYGNMYV